MDLELIDWDALQRLRTAFLEGSAGEHDYWHSPTDLASYDQTFAQRIGWKWDYVLRELTRRGWSPPTGAVLDWGCGSGIAGRAFLDHFGPQAVSELLLWDRSPMAVNYARGKAGGRFPDLPISAFDSPASARPFATLLLSHVLTELQDGQLDALFELASRATAVLWVEPGTHQTSRRLSRLRDRFVGEFNVVAPCTHQARCGMLLPGREQHWCHHFATPPPTVFTDGNWARFAALAGIDLRSLPLSFMVLDKRPQPAMPAGAVRMIGRPRVHKGYALALGCDTAGVCERRLSKRTEPELFRQWKKGQADPLQVWECQAHEIMKARSLDESVQS